jgi:hypothetical protein
VELLQDLRTLLEMRSGFPSIVLVPIPCPLDQVLPPLFSLSPTPNILDLKILVALNLLSRGDNS